jgi:serine/threonine protein phosphatase PrpC
MTTHRSEDNTLEWAAAVLPMPGHTRAADLCLVKPRQGKILVAVFDGLGHGDEAFAAAELAAATLDKSAGVDPAALATECHRALVRTRGVVMSLAVFDRADRSMTWLGIGNVEGTLFRANSREKTERPARETLLLRSGVVGYRIPRLRPARISLEPGDLLILTTDGIRGGFADDLDLRRAPKEIAELIMSRHCRGTDDALVLAARWLG